MFVGLASRIELLDAIGAISLECYEISPDMDCYTHYRNQRRPLVLLSFVSLQSPIVSVQWCDCYGVDPLHTSQNINDSANIISTMFSDERVRILVSCCVYWFCLCATIPSKYLQNTYTNTYWQPVYTAQKYSSR